LRALAARWLAGAPPNDWALGEEGVERWIGPVSKGRPIIATVQQPLLPVRWPRFDTHVAVTLPYQFRNEGDLPVDVSLLALRDLEDRLVALLGDVGDLLAHETTRGRCSVQGHYVELVALGVGQHHPVFDPGEFGGAEPDQPGRLALDVGGAQVEVDPILRGLRLGHQGEEQARRAGRRGLHQDGRVVLRIMDSLGAQAFQLLVVVGCHRVPVQRRGPEPGQRRRVRAVEDDIADRCHEIRPPGPDRRRHPARRVINKRRTPGMSQWIVDS
jgi:hypothetical protein